MTAKRFEMGKKRKRCMAQAVTDAKKVFGLEPSYKGVSEVLEYVEAQFNYLMDKPKRPKEPVRAADKLSQRRR